MIVIAGMSMNAVSPAASLALGISRIRWKVVLSIVVANSVVVKSPTTARVSVLRKIKRMSPIDRETLLRKKDRFFRK